MVTHCSSVRVVPLCRLATLGSTLMQYSVSQKRLLMLNSGEVSITSYCNDQSVGWYLRAPSSCRSAGLVCSSLLPSSLGVLRARPKLPVRTGEPTAVSRAEKSLPCCGEALY